MIYGDTPRANSDACSNVPPDNVLINWNVEPLAIRIELANGTGIAHPNLYNKMIKIVKVTEVSNHYE